MDLYNSKYIIAKWYTLSSTGIRRRHADKHNSICMSLDVDGYWSPQFPILLYFSTVFLIRLLFSVFIHLSIYTCPLHRCFGVSLVRFTFSIFLCPVSSSGRRLTCLCTASHMQKIVYFFFISHTFLFYQAIT